MQRMIVNIENCYGIGKLAHDFDFNPANPNPDQATRAYSIYAPNGFMKTSLSKTFQDLIKGDKSSDLINPERASTRTIQDENGVDIKGENVFVIEPYNQDFTSEKTSLLLVNQTLKKQYDEALLKIEEKKNALLKKLKQLSGLAGKTITPETELLKCFGQTSIYDLFESLESEIQKKADDRLAVITYNELFNDKVVSLLESGTIRIQLKEYIEKYNELVDKSPILSKTFNHYHAKTVHKNLSENGFFSAKHSVNLFNGVDREEITSGEALEARIEDEKKKILSNKDLNTKFEEIDKKLTTKELREFRDYLLDNKDIVAELAEYKNLQKAIWIAYLSSQKDDVNDFLLEFRKGKEVIQQAIDTAKNEKTEWEEVVKQFNERFSVPFTMEVANQEDVILKGSSPRASFLFQDEGQAKSKEVNRDTLLKVLSLGERRALYILNILFELNGRRKQGLETIIIADDIADSFDYKNKYAIVEYLKDITELNNFYCIFLTHNFDFHRTISGRINIPHANRMVAFKNGRHLFLKKEAYSNNPFEHWKKNFGEPRFVISAIPFVRNLAEFCGKKLEYSKLTSLLHMKADTQAITIQNLEAIYKDILNMPNLALTGANKPVIDLIGELADAIQAEPDDTAELESKIILSLAIRLNAEKFMVRKIADQPFVDGITKNQTRALIKRFKGDFPHEAQSIALIEQVNLMTPENIHLNSFMYEPILDMAPEHLKRLYTDVKAVNP